MSSSLPRADVAPGELAERLRDLVTGSWLKFNDAATFKDAVCKYMHVIKQANIKNLTKSTAQKTFKIVADYGDSWGLKASQTEDWVETMTKRFRWEDGVKKNAVWARLDEKTSNAEEHEEVEEDFEQTGEDAEEHPRAVKGKSANRRQLAKRPSSSQDDLEIGWDDELRLGYRIPKGGTEKQKEMSLPPKIKESDKDEDPDKSEAMMPVTIGERRRCREDQKGGGGKPLNEAEHRITHNRINTTQKVDSALRPTFCDQGRQPRQVRASISGEPPGAQPCRVPNESEALQKAKRLFHGIVDDYCKDALKDHRGARQKTLRVGAPNGPIRPPAATDPRQTSAEAGTKRNVVAKKPAAEAAKREKTCNELC